MLHRHALKSSHTLTLVQRRISSFPNLDPNPSPYLDMSRKASANNAYVNGMEVSGIDPQIVREEQQQERSNETKLKLPLGGVNAGFGGTAHPQHIFSDQSAFQGLMGQSGLQATLNSSSPGSSTTQAGQRGSGHVSNQTPSHSQQHGHQRHQQMQAMPQAPQFGQNQQFPQMTNMYMQAQPQSSNQQVRSHQQVIPNPQTKRTSNSRVISSIVGSSGDVKPGNRDLMMSSSSDRLNSPPVSNSNRIGKRRVRLGWTEEETRHLMEGCKRHGVGNWKKILTDPSFEFNCRTAVDLKDRFRTSFPEEYSRLYPNARTHKVKRPNGPNEMSSLVKINRKERRSFTPEEDDRLLQGFLKHGPAWSKIQRDPALSLGERRSTDLRDRFRNAFPERYTAAGYKGRSGGKNLLQSQEMAVQSSQMQQMQPMNMLEDDVHLPQHVVPRAYMPQHPLPLQGMQGMGYQYFTN